MPRYILSRILQFIPVILLSTVLVFAVIRITPGDPVYVRFGRRASDARYAEAVRQYRERLGLDKPIPVQYVLWLNQMIRGNFGDSIHSQQPVVDLILQKLPATLQLMVASLLFGLVFGVPLGITAALKRGTLIDTIAGFISVAGMAIPGFWLGMIMIWIFALRLGWLPSAGYVPLTENVGKNLQLLIMPMVTVGLYEMAVVTRFLRAEIVEVLSSDYIRTARAKGLRERAVLLRHTLKNALIPLITVVALEAGFLLGGAVVVEQVFGWSGVGWLAFQAIGRRDYPIVQGVVLLLGVGFAATNLLADIIYTYLDPRIRY